MLMSGIEVAIYYCAIVHALAMRTIVYVSHVLFKSFELLMYVRKHFVPWLEKNSTDFKEYERFYFLCFNMCCKILIFCL